MAKPKSLKKYPQLRRKRTRRAKDKPRLKTLTRAKKKRLKSQSVT